MDTLSLPVVHPASEKLKRNGAWLHVSAGLLIITHAFSHFNQPESSLVYFWCQLIISLDIFILVLAGKDALYQLPRVNLFFRVVEITFFLVIGLMMLLQGKAITSIIHIALGIVYCYLFYCEKKLLEEKLLSFHHIGVTIPGMPESKFLLWTHINDVKANYDSILITTSEEESIVYDLRKNLDFVELEQIHEFCRHYLGKV
jgi:hypothetical protein